LGDRARPRAARDGLLYNKSQRVGWSGGSRSTLAPTEKVISERPFYGNRRSRCVNRPVQASDRGHPVGSARVAPMQWYVS